MRTFNLPPGVLASDIDPPCCRVCEGNGEIENPDFGKPGAHPMNGPAAGDKKHQKQKKGTI